jgi:hypothetical protein
MTSISDLIWIFRHFCFPPFCFVWFSYEIYLHNPSSDSTFNDFFFVWSKSRTGEWYDCGRRSCLVGIRSEREDCFLGLIASRIDSLLDWYLVGLLAWRSLLEFVKFKPRPRNLPTPNVMFQACKHCIILQQNSDKTSLFTSVIDRKEENIPKKNFQTVEVCVNIYPFKQYIMQPFYEKFENGKFDLLTNIRENILECLCFWIKNLKVN